MADDFDFDMDEFDIDGDMGEGVGDERAPVASTSQNVKTAFVSGLSGEGDDLSSKAKNNLKEALDKAAPKMLGEKNGGDLLDAFSEASYEISDAKDKVAKSSEPLLKSIKGIVPNDSMMSKLTDKIANLIGADIEKTSRNTGPSEDEIIGNSINSSMGEFTNRFEESSTKLASITASITDANLKRVNETITSGNVVALQALDMNNRFYRESLKLNFKQLYELKSINKRQAEIAMDSMKKLDALIHNTALPDGLKMQTTEAIALQMKLSAGESLYNNMFRSNEWLDDVKRNIKDKVTGATSALIDGFAAGEAGVDMYNQVADSAMDEDDLAMMSETDRANASKEGMAANMAAGQVRGGVLGLLANRLSKTKLGKKVRYQSDKLFSNPYDSIKNYSKTVDSELGSKSLDFIASIFKPRGTSVETKAYEDKKNLNGLATFDNRTYETINKVLPSILSKMLRELKVLNGDKGAEVEKYHYLESTFMKEDTVASKLKKDLAEKYKDGNLNSTFETVSKRLEELSGIELSEDERREFIQSLSKFDSKVSVDYLDTQVDREDGLFSGVDDKQKMKYMSILKGAGDTNYIGEDENGKLVQMNDSERRYDTDELLTTINSTKLENSKKIIALIEDGFSQPLMDAGLVDYDKRTQTYSVNWDAYKKMNIDAMMEAYDSSETIITKKDEEHAKRVKEVRDAKDKFEEKLEKGYGATKQFIKDKKIDVFLKEKLGIAKGDVKSLIDKLDRHMSQYEKYNVAIGYISKKYDTAKAEYLKLQGELKAAKNDGDVTKIKQKMKIVQDTIVDIAKEKTHYEELKAKVETTKEYMQSSDIYTLEADMIKKTNSLKDTGKKFIKDKELDIMFSDIEKVSKEAMSKGNKIYASLKGKVEDSEAFQTVDSFYTTKIKTLIEEENKLTTYINTLSDDSKKKKYLKKVVKLKKQTEKLVKDRDKHLKKFSFDGAKERLKEVGGNISDFTYTDLKKASKDTYKKGKDKIDEIKEEKKADTFFNRLMTRIDAFKKPKVAGDKDGDGDRDNGWRDIFSRDKKKKETKENTNTKKSKDEKSTSWLGKLLGGAFMMLPTIIGGMASSVGSSLSVLKNIGLGVGGLLGFFKGKGLITSLTTALWTPIKWLSTGLGRSMLASTGILAQIIGGMVSLLGMKKLGRTISKTGRDTVGKSIKGSMLQKAMGLIMRNKGKLAIGALLAYTLAGTDANAGDVDPERLEEFMNEAETNDDIDSDEPVGYDENGNPIVGMATDMAMFSGASYLGNKALQKGKRGYNRLKARKRLSRMKSNKANDKEVHDQILKETEKIKKEEATKQKTKLHGDVTKVNKSEKGMWSFLKKKLGKVGFKSVMKRLPGVGTAMGLGLAASQLAGGDYAKAGLSVLSSVANMIPLIGTAASIGIDSYADSIPPSEKKWEDMSREERHALADKARTKDAVEKKKKLEEHNYKVNVNYDYEKMKVEKATLSKSSRLTKGDRLLLESIAQYESKKGKEGYNSVNSISVLKLKEKPTLTKMTLIEVLKLQNALVAKGKSGAVGKYQFIPATLKETFYKAGIKMTDLFDAETQDTMIIKRLVLVRKYQEWREGLISDRHFVYELSKEFASIENPGTGKTYYTSTNNVAHNSWKNMKAVLVKVRELDKLKDSGIEDEKFSKHKTKTKDDVPKRDSADKGSSNGLVSGVMSAIKAALEFFGAGSKSGKNSKDYFEKTELEGDAEESKPGSKYKEHASGGGIKVALPKETITDKDLCGLTIKKLPPIKKASEKAGNLTFNGDPKYLVIHNTAGSNLYLGRMKKDGYGTQLWIDKDGTIYLIGDILSVYYHVGKRRPEYHQISSVVSLGIEMVCNYNKSTGWEPYTDKQKDALSKVGACLMKNYNITKDRVVWHAMISYKTKDEGKEGAMLLRGMQISHTDTVSDTPEQKRDTTVTPQSSPKPMIDNRPSKETGDADVQTTDTRNITQKSTVAKQEVVTKIKDNVTTENKVPMREVDVNAMHKGLTGLYELAKERNEILRSIDTGIHNLNSKENTPQVKEKKIKLKETQPPMTIARNI